MASRIHASDIVGPLAADSPFSEAYALIEDVIWNLMALNGADQQLIYCLTEEENAKRELAQRDTVISAPIPREGDAKHQNLSNIRIQRQAASDRRRDKIADLIITNRKISWLDDPIESLVFASIRVAQPYQFAGSFKPSAIASVWKFLAPYDRLLENSNRVFSVNSLQNFFQIYERIAGNSWAVSHHLGSPLTTADYRKIHVSFDLELSRLRAHIMHEYSRVLDSRTPMTKSTAVQFRSWKQANLDQAIREYRNEHSERYRDLAGAVARGRPTAFKAAKGIFSQAAIMKALGVKPGSKALIKKSRAWQAIAAELRLNEKSPRKGKRIGLGQAEEAAGIEAFEDGEVDRDKADELADLIAEQKKDGRSRKIRD